MRVEPVLEFAHRLVVLFIAHHRLEADRTLGVQHVTGPGSLAGGFRLLPALACAFLGRGFWLFFGLCVPFRHRLHRFFGLFQWRSLRHRESGSDGRGDSRGRFCWMSLINV